MSLINQKVRYKGKSLDLQRGVGVVKNQEGDYIELYFEKIDKTLKIVFPDSIFSGINVGFVDIFRFEDSQLQKELEYVVNIRKQEKKEQSEKECKEALEKIRKENDEKARVLSEKKAQERAEKNKLNGVDKLKKIKKIDKYNIAFKCTYCDGGSDENSVGFRYICSDSIMKNNVLKSNATRYCATNDCPCKKYLDGKLSYSELEKLVNAGFVCIESRLLNDWKADAGIVMRGINKGKANKIQHVQEGSLAVLTTRTPKQKEEDRFVFGVFIVDSTYVGDNREAGYVTTTSKYKLELTSSEAEKIKYWNYNRNKNDSIRWGQGLFRYLSDEQCVKLLRDIVEVKKGTKDEDLSKEFLEYFCKINNIDMNKC